MSSLLERMEEGFGSFFDEFNKTSTSELIAKLESLGIITDATEKEESSTTSFSLSVGPSRNSYKTSSAIRCDLESFDELIYAA